MPQPAECTLPTDADQVGVQTRISWTIQDSYADGSFLGCSKLCNWNTWIRWRPCSNRKCAGHPRLALSYAALGDRRPAFPLGKIDSPQHGERGHRDRISGVMTRRDKLDLTLRDRRTDVNGLKLTSSAPASYGNQQERRCDPQRQARSSQGNLHSDSRYAMPDFFSMVAPTRMEVKSHASRLDFNRQF